ncbi:MAG TPA: MAPEG family protein [Caulobacteraceae bacterium]
MIVQNHSLVAIVTLISLLLYFMMGLRVGEGRTKFGIVAPAVTGHPEFERRYRVQVNTLEWLPIYIVSLWLFALYWNDRIAALVGVVWIVGRILYMVSYSKDAASRGPGFGIQALATGFLLFGALGKIIWVAIHTGV